MAEIIKTDVKKLLASSFLDHLEKYTENLLYKITQIYTFYPSIGTIQDKLAKLDCFLILKLLDTENIPHRLGEYEEVYQHDEYIYYYDSREIYTFKLSIFTNNESKNDFFRDVISRYFNDFYLLSIPGIPLEESEVVPYLTQRYTYCFYEEGANSGVRLQASPAAFIPIEGSLLVTEFTVQMHIPKYAVYRYPAIDQIIIAPYDDLSGTSPDAIIISGSSIVNNNAYLDVHF